MNDWTKYNYKSVSAGDVTEIYIYRWPQYKKKPTTDQLDKEVVKDQIKKEKSSKNFNDENEEKKVRSRISIERTKRQIKRLVNANINQNKNSDKFITLTFEGDDPTRKKTCYKFKEFARKMRNLFGRFDYLAVIEAGIINGRLHIHLIAFGLEYIKKDDLAKIWNNGFVDIKEIRNVRNVENYLLKYLEKAFEDGYIAKGEKFYFVSQGLKKPIERFYEDDYFLHDDDLGTCECDIDLKSAFVGDMIYQRYRRVNYDEYDDDWPFNW